jgi:Domain of unknown function (DUF397)
MINGTPSRTPWRKSSYSGQSNGCVEVADRPDGGKLVRDSKLGDNSPVLSFTAHEWACFVAGIESGELR